MAAVTHSGSDFLRSLGPLDSVLHTLQGDKKVKDGRLRFVLPTAIGHVEIRDDINRDEILRCLEQLRG